MSCENLQELTSSLLDQRGSAAERQHAMAHLASCHECSARYESMANTRATTRSLPQPAVPAAVQLKLRAVADRDRIQRLARVGFSDRFNQWMSTFQVHCQNMMRPMALPVAGGVISAVLLFGMWIPNLTATPQSLSGDVSAPIFTDPSLSRSNPVRYGGDVVVKLIIDERGKVADYEVIQGQDSEELRNFILFSTWTPATSFGKPTWGKALWSHGEAIQVKG